MHTKENKQAKNKSIALIIGSISFLLISGSVSAYYLYFLPQQKADTLALEQRKLDISEKEKADKLELEKEKHSAALELEKEKNQNELSIKQAELNRELEEDCQKQISQSPYKNIQGGSYNPFTDECEVNYRDQNGEIIFGAVLNDLVSVPKSKIEVSVLEDDGSMPTNENLYFVRYKEPVEFQGTVSANCNSILVTATNLNFEKPDEYFLKGYKPGDISFVYHASQKLFNLGVGTTVYEFKATCEDGNVSTTIAVNFKE
ncbi:hypothetical protein IT413_05955 [Candidatus Peregrinibacteria bacterium]|nr:hypothetical protein [Candidatus Peregrinibacteria bacterium]